MSARGSALGAIGALCTFPRGQGDPQSRAPTPMTHLSSREEPSSHAPLSLPCVAPGRLMLSDEDTVRFSCGDCFLHLEKDKAEERLQSTTDESQADVKGIETEISDIKGQLKVRMGTGGRAWWCKAPCIAACHATASRMEQSRMGAWLRRAPAAGWGAVSESAPPSSSPGPHSTGSRMSAMYWRERGLMPLPFPPCLRSLRTSRGYYTPSSRTPST